jgi:hypothetical protein
MRNLSKSILIIPLVFSLSACSSTEQSANQPEPAPITQQSQATPSTPVQTEAVASQIEKKLNLTDPKMLKPATNATDFILQTSEYTTELAIVTATIQSQMKGEVVPSEFKEQIQPDLVAYNSAIKKALSIPKPTAGKLKEAYNTYISIIEEYAKFPDLLQKGLDANDRKLIEESYAQIDKTSEKFKKLLVNVAAP